MDAGRIDGEKNRLFTGFYADSRERHERGCAGLAERA
jgi:hypothetical protein